MRLFQVSAAVVSVGVVLVGVRAAGDWPVVMALSPVPRIMGH